MKPKYLAIHMKITCHFIANRLLQIIEQNIAVYITHVSRGHTTKKGSTKV